jgi:hypothetical protein
VQGTWHDVVAAIRSSLSEPCALENLELYHLGQGGKRMEFVGSMRFYSFYWGGWEEGEGAEAVLEGLGERMRVMDNRPFVVDAVFP